MSPCMFCLEPLNETEDRELVFLESGQLAPMRKDPRFFKFLADWACGDAGILAQSIATSYHASCFIDKMHGLKWGKNSPLGCDLCGRSFYDSKWAYRVRLGYFDKYGLFIPIINSQNEALICPFCIAEGFGEGNIKRGEDILNYR